MYHETKFKLILKCPNPRWGRHFAWSSHFYQSYHNGIFQRVDLSRNPNLKKGRRKLTSATLPTALLLPWELTPTISQSMASAFVKLKSSEVGIRIEEDRDEESSSLSLRFPKMFDAVVVVRVFESGSLEEESWRFERPPPRDLRLCLREAQLGLRTGEAFSFFIVAGDLLSCRRFPSGRTRSASVF